MSSEALSSSRNDRPECEEDTESHSNSDVQDSGSSSCEDYSSSDEEEEENVWSSFLEKLQKNGEIQEVLHDPPCVSTIPAQFEKLTSISFQNHNHSHAPLDPHVLPLSSISPSQHEILTALNNISSKLEHSTIVSTPPGNTNHSSTQHAVRQIAYWSSFFINMCHTQSSTSQPSSSSSSSATSSQALPAPQFSEPDTLPHSLQHTSPPQPEALSLLPSHASSPSQLQPASSLPCMSSSQAPSLSLPLSLPSHVPSPSHACRAPPSQLPPAYTAIDGETLKIYKKYGEKYQDSQDWLKHLHIPRNVESLEDVKSIWECGGKDCPPLCEWTPKMRTHKVERGSHSSIFNQRKKIYNLFKSFNFDVSSLFVKYKETKPGKLYKVISSKEHR